MKAGFSAASAAVEAFHSPCWLHCIGLLSGIGLISKPNAAFKKRIFPSFVSLFATVLSHLSIFTSHFVPLPLRAVYNPIFIMLFFCLLTWLPLLIFHFYFLSFSAKCQVSAICFSLEQWKSCVMSKWETNSMQLMNQLQPYANDSKYESFIYMLLRSWNTSAGIDGLTSTS